MNTGNPEVNHDEQDSPTFNQERTAVFQNFDINELKDPTAIPTKDKKLKKPKEFSKKKKSKEITLDIAEEEKGIDTSVPSRQKKNSGGDTPKFGESIAKGLRKANNQGLELASIQLETNLNNDKTLEKSSIRPDNTILSDDEDFEDMRPKNVKYKENIMRGLNVVSYLTNKRVPAGNKVFYLFIIFLIIGSYAANITDFITYATTKCTDSDFDPAMYFNFFIIFFSKLGLFSYITSEINKNLEYDLKFPFIVPILTIGVLANLQLPLVLYDYKTCEERSSFIKGRFGFFVVDTVAIIIGAVIVSILAGLIIFMRCKLPHNIVKGFKTAVSFIAIDLMLIMNALFLIVTFSQIDKFSPSLLAENIVFWTLVVSGLIIFIIQKRYKTEVFMALDGLETEADFRSKDQTTRDQTQQQQQEYEIVEPPLSTDRLRRTPRTKLEKIDENEEEDEKSVAVSKINPKKYTEENGFVPDVINGKVRSPTFAAPALRAR